MDPPNIRQRKAQEDRIAAIRYQQEESQKTYALAAFEKSSDRQLQRRMAADRMAAAEAAIAQDLYQRRKKYVV